MDQDRDWYAVELDYKPDELNKDEEEIRSFEEVVDLLRAEEGLYHITEVDEKEYLVTGTTDDYKALKVFTREKELYVNNSKPPGFVTLE